jgi:tRNA (guanine-N7-)-methyltransferase
MSTDNTSYRRTVKSFVLRAGRTTPGQLKALEQYWPRYGLSLAQGSLDIQAAFGNDHPVIVEIGFGMGSSLLQMAQANPQQNYIGIEVHQAGVGRLLNAAAQAQLENLRIYQDDAVAVLDQCIADQSLAGIQLFFPDPWPKKKHHKRRIVQPDFIALMHRKLKPGGFLHMATDWQPYAEHMMQVMLAAPGFINQYGNGQYASERPNKRPLTKFEQRGTRLGHGVWDLYFIVV